MPREVPAAAGREGARPRAKEILTTNLPMRPGRWRGRARSLLRWAAALACLAAAPARAERLPVKTYTAADGLQRDEVSRVRRDSRGFIWFCTSEGVSRFDGAGMTTFTVADGLPNRFVEDFLETSRGTIYVATWKGLARLNPVGLRASKENPLFTVFLPDNPKAEKILNLYEDRGGRVWAGTSDGLYRLVEAGGRVSFEAVALGEPLVLNPYDLDTLYVTAILEDRRGALWVGTQGSGLFRLAPGGAARRFTAADGLGGNYLLSLLEGRDGRLWAGMRHAERGGLCLLDAGDAERPVKKCYTMEDGLPTNWIPGMLETSDGAMWLATVSGLCRWQGEGAGAGCKTYTEKNDLCAGVFSLVEDGDGNLWAGGSCGAKRIARYGFTTYTQADGLDYPQANSIFENRAGELFVTTSARGWRIIHRFDGERFSAVRAPVPGGVRYGGWGWQQTVWHDGRGAWWIPTGAGLFRSPGGTSYEALARAPLTKVETGSKGNEIFRVFEDSRGDIWITMVGLSFDLRRWERATDTWHDYTGRVGFSLDRIGSAFAEDRHGNVWVGASSDRGDSALVRFRGGEIRVLTAAEGAPTGWVRDLFLDGRGRLWIASTNDGLWRLDDTNSDRFDFVKYAPAQGLTSLSTACVTEDEFGRIYVGTWRGVDRLDPETGQIENLGTADGLPGSFVENAYRDREGALWFATRAGLARFRPEPVRQRRPPTILITGLRAGGAPRAVSILGETEISNLALDSDERQVSVDFLGLGASLGEKLRYEYRLGDAGWTQTSERTVNFANLAPGAYRFEVRAVTADRLASAAPASVSFRVAAPLWQRAWFLAALAASAALLIYLFYRHRLARLLEVERMRTRIATDLHDDIGANLTKISLLGEVSRRQYGDDPAAGRESPLAAIARISRESVSAMGDIVWAIDPERDTLLDLVRKMRQHAEETFEPRDIELQFDAAGAESELRLGVDVRRDFFLVFKEAVNNAARHSGCARAEVRVRCEGHRLSLTVSDDGRGFDAADGGESEAGGYGLASMRRRAAAMGGTLSVESRPGAGTTVSLSVPVGRGARAPILRRRRRADLP